MLSQKTTENFLYGMYFFHIIITTLDQWTRSFFPPLGILEKKEELL